MAEMTNHRIHEPELLLDGTLVLVPSMVILDAEEVAYEALGADWV
jgi:hypothetical protein